MPRPTRSTTRRRSRRSPKASGLPRAASRSAISSTSAPSIPKPMKAVVAGPGGEQITVEMGSYGIGVSRLVGGIIEASHDDAGIVWPESVAPFKVAIVNLKPDDGAVSGACQKLYDGLAGQGRRGAARRPRPAARRQVRRHGPDRHALAGDRRPQGAWRPARPSSRTARPASARNCRSTRSPSGSAEPGHGASWPSPPSSA